MKKFKGFTNTQTHQLLKEFGYNGPAQKDDMDAFLASSPSAASQLGRYKDIARQRVEGKPLSGIGMQAGGNVANAEQAARLKEQQQAALGVAQQPDKNLEALFTTYSPVSRITGTPTARSGPSFTSMPTETDTGGLATTGAQLDPSMVTSDPSFDPHEDVFKNMPTATPELETLQGEKQQKAQAVTDLQNKLRMELRDGLAGFFGNPITSEERAEIQRKIEASPEYQALQKSEQDISSLIESGAGYTRGGTAFTPPPRQAVPAEIGRMEALAAQTQADPTTPEGTQVLQFGTPTPETTEASQLLDTAQETLADTTRNLTKVQQDMSGKDPEDVYYRRDDYSELSDGTDAEQEAAAGDFMTPILAHISRPETDAFTPEQIAEFDTNGDGTVNISDVVNYNRIYSGLGPLGLDDSVYERMLNQTKEHFLNKYPGGPVTYKQALEDAELAQTQAGANVQAQEAAYKIEDVPSTAEALGKAITNPSSILQKPTVYGLKVEDGQLIDEGTGQVATAATLLVKQAQDAGEADDPAVKATMAYVQGLDDAEFRPGGKYPPYPKAIPMVTPLPESTVKDIADYYDRQQAQIAQDAKKDTAETYEAVKSEDKIKAIDELGDFAEGVLSDDAKMQAEQMTPSTLAQLQGEFKDPAKLESYNVVLTEDDVVRINEERTRMQAAMANALTTGNTAAYEDIKAAYEQASAAVNKAIETGTIVGELKQDSEEFPSAAVFDSYTTSEEQEFEGDVEDVDPAKFEDETPKAPAEVDYNLPPTQVAEQKENKIKDAAQFDEYATAPEKKSEFEPDVTAEETIVGADEIVDVNKILNSEEVVVAAKTLEALNGDAVAEAQSASFTQQLEAKAVKGTVRAASTVQGQLENLMNQFNDGTPAWAAGALRRVTAAMNARGMGGSSMASAAMIQAAMESAIPIAQSDAATFQAMDMENVRNEQAVALANAAAAQNFELANLSNRQATNLQNSMNNSNLQLKNLSNEQEAVLAMAQFKASLQGQELSISSNVAIANAARYAAVNDINLTNRQQTSILRSTQNLEVEMANLSNEQQTALSNLQVKAAMMGQDLTNEQQMAVLESTQAFEANMGDATRKQQAFIQDAVATAAMEGRVLDNKQQTALFNVANAVAEREIELNNEQQTAIFNMSNKMTIGLEEMSGRQQTALANAQIEAAMKGQELSNKQQVAIIKSERIAEIANMNFTAEQSRALQNAQLTQTVDLANLSNTQAKLLADCAALTDVDMANLNNRQQAQAQQAQAFLQMDMANLDNEQQAVMFEAQSLVQSVFSDQAAENAQLQFNAESINQVNQFFDQISTQVTQFNIAQSNAMEQFNAGEENSMTKFQAELDNQRDMFNAQNELVVAQANTVWRQSVATANTAALNEANMAEVMAANNMTMQGLAELWQQERDLMNYAWTTSENAVSRDHELILAKIKQDTDEDSAFSGAAGLFLSSVVRAVWPSTGTGTGT